MTTLTQKKDEATSKTDLARDPLQVLGFPSLNRMRHEFDELLSKFFTEVPALWNAERGDGRWAFEVEDQPDSYVIKAEAPGFEQNDFNINLRGNQLVMQAKRSEEKKDKGKESFASSEFYHAMTIPQFVDEEKISASYKQGLLQITLPKTADGKGRKISVKGE